MIEGWDSVQLKDVATLSGGYAFKSSQYTDDGRFILRTLNIDHNGSISEADAKKYISEDEAAEYERFALREFDTLFVMVGATLGKTGFIKASDLPALLNQNMWVIRAKGDAADPHFLHYQFREISKEAISWASGSARSFLKRDDVRELHLPFPPLPEQKAIAEVLSSLDDKIDLLHRQNATLEALAETLFRQYFIEEAQDDWEEETLERFVELNPRYSLSKGALASYIEMKSLSETTFAPSGWYDRAFTSGTKFKNGDTLMARITPCLENGKTCFVTILNEGEIGWGSTEYIVMRVKPHLHPLFAYVLARFGDFRDFAISSMTGSSGRQRVQVESLKEFTLPVPPKGVLSDFNRSCNAIAEKLKFNLEQIQTLEKLRDTLLPRLMSGAVRVAFDREVA